MKVVVPITQSEIHLLFRDVSGCGGFQNLLREVQSSLVGFRLELEWVLAERVARYADSYGEGGFQSRIRSVAVKVRAKMAEMTPPTAGTQSLFD